MRPQQGEPDVERDSVRNSVYVFTAHHCTISSDHGASEQNPLKSYGCKHYDPRINEVNDNASEGMHLVWQNLDSKL